MATKYFYFIGTCEWAQVHEEDKFGKTGLKVYLTPGSWETFKKSELRLQTKTDDKGEFVRFSRSWKNVFEPEKPHGPPNVLIRNEAEDRYDPFDGFIGNGSLVNCKVLVYDSKNGKGHRLETIAVENLIPYTPGPKNEDENGLEMPF